jgi:hypothetical protein
MMTRGLSKKASKKTEEEEEILPQGKYSMMQYAKDYFRQGQDLYEMTAAGGRDSIGKSTGLLCGIS